MLVMEIKSINQYKITFGSTCTIEKKCLKMQNAEIVNFPCIYLFQYVTYIRTFSQSMNLLIATFIVNIYIYINKLY